MKQWDAANGHHQAHFPHVLFITNHFSLLSSFYTSMSTNSTLFPSPDRSWFRGIQLHANNAIYHSYRTTHRQNFRKGTEVFDPFPLIPLGLPYIFKSESPYLTLTLAFHNLFPSPQKNTLYSCPITLIFPHSHCHLHFAL